MSGVGFLATVKTFTPGGRRRRRCEKQQKVLELPPGYGMQPDVVPSWDTAPPITPPAAFLPPGYKKGFPVQAYFKLCIFERENLLENRSTLHNDITTTNKALNSLIVIAKNSSIGACTIPASQMNLSDGSWIKVQVPIDHFGIIQKVQVERNTRIVALYLNKSSLSLPRLNYFRFRNCLRVT
ncbi:hypothetical protein ALC56_13379 [Trachymyrmex septentrionalis]|uniref:Uncharacterized protein n=1 Tax=Trachymyrmex septentrionalis TaxID=34720 RepID=A0A195EWJ5_9HYME|nr:hypothetical protein ALC56_13379 [Trachymyrmex septentrionalis]